MLDIQFIRDNPELVGERSRQKGYPVDIAKLLELDSVKNTRRLQIDELRHRRNQLTEGLKNQKPAEEQIAQGRQLKSELASLEEDLKLIEDQFILLLKQVPNLPLDDVPVGSSEADNVVALEWGVKKEFDFQPKSHWAVAEAKDLIDKQRAAKVAGSRFAYVKGGLVEMQFGLIQFVLQSLGDEQLLQRLIADNKLDLAAKPFTPVLPPAMIRTDVFEAMDRLEPRDDRYRVGEAVDELWLQGSAEHTLGSMYQDEILAADSLPIRYIGYSSSFRREAGSYGKDSEGIFRMHQFDKLEMEVFSTPESGRDEHLLLIAIQQWLMQQLELPYRLIEKCTADIGKPNARGIDIDAWLPGQGQYRETHTADYMTDYQARRLNSRLRRPHGAIDWLHTNDATAFALGRTLIAIIENYQTASGDIIVPDVLRPYMAGKEKI